MCNPCAGLTLHTLRIAATLARQDLASLSPEQRVEVVDEQLAGVNQNAACLALGCQSDHSLPLGPLCMRQLDGTPEMYVQKALVCYANKQHVNRRSSSLQERSGTVSRAAAAIAATAAWHRRRSSC